MRTPPQLVFWSSLEPSRAALLYVPFLQHWRACELKTIISDDMSTKNYNKPAHASRFTYTDIAFATRGRRGCLSYLPQRDAQHLEFEAIAPRFRVLVGYPRPHYISPASAFVTYTNPPHPQGEDGPARHDT
ncbi:hypothetical protein D9619_008349 [Psilocybe cf. subviscida]|uniref:Uncharacterized protein n=1 Tax=Psilocybe cf. subviscida TaxID=2480587 RepID=A0A8H5BA21_9AGAR|nr:hypothetical protein D9619_008349 [Psilocybe cf. subviscida]